MSNAELSQLLDELLGLCKVHRHIFFLGLILTRHLPTMCYELDLALMNVALAIIQSWRSSIRDSYLSSLFDPKNSNFMVDSIFSQTGGLITSPPPHPILVDDPSCSLAGGLVVHSIMKFCKACALMALLSSYCILKSAS